MTHDTYDYTMYVYDHKGRKLQFIALDEPDQSAAEMLAEEWATQGGVDVDWIEVITTNDPRGIIDTGNW